MTTTFYHRRLRGDDAANRSAVTITDDGTDYRYDIEKSELEDFLAWAEHTFAGGMNAKTIEGEWPFYDVRQPS